MQESWKWVDGYEGRYLVSDSGEIMALPSKTHYGHVMKQKTTAGGYKHVCLCMGNVKKDYAVHRIVATAFVPNIENKPEVNHKDGNKTNNKAGNLEWVTRSENERHKYHVLGVAPNKPWAGKPRLFARRFTEEQVNAIRNDCRSNTEIADEYGVSKTAIRNIKIKKNYAEVV